MKSIILIVTLFSTFNCFANVAEKKLLLTYKKLINRKLYFSAIPYGKEIINSSIPINQKITRLLEKQILKTGSSQFESISQNALKKRNTNITNYLLVLKLFKKKRYHQAYKTSQLITKDFRFFPEMNFIAGASLASLEQSNQAIKMYQQCQESAQKFAGKFKNKKIIRYYNYLKESCIVHQARSYYAKKDYPQAVKFFNQIEKASYRWPSTLLEKAWAEYYQGNFNRTLGLLVTYKSPLLASYFYPEGEVLSALSYHKLCLWDDGITKVNEYYNLYKKRSDHLVKILNKHKSSNSYFIKLVMAPVKKNEKVNPFIRNLVTNIKKQVKFSLEIYNLKRSKAELRRLRKFPKTKFNKTLISNLKKIINSNLTLFNHYVKKSMFDFTNEIHKYSYEMFKLKLDFLAKKRSEYYKAQRNVTSKERIRGEKLNIKQTVYNEYWDFKGAFWADELGEYSFALSSNCKDDNSLAMGRL